MTCRFARGMLGLGALAVGLWAASPIAGQSSTDGGAVPKVVRDGMNQFKNGAPAGLRALLKGGAAPDEADHPAATAVLATAEKTYGAYEGFDVIEVDDLSPRSRIVYLAMNYGKGAVFAKLVLYRCRTGWVVSRVQAGADPDQVLARRWARP